MIGNNVNQRRVWFERSFNYDLEPTALPDIIERLRGTPLRLEERLLGIAPEALVHRKDDRWSIQEHAGHLADLEPLWLGRFEDLAARAPVLRPTDLTNQATWSAGHNDARAQLILDHFRALRATLVATVERLQPEELMVTAAHPRLGQPMTAMDLSFFVAEHDDHHLAAITALRAVLNVSADS